MRRMLVIVLATALVCLVIRTHRNWAAEPPAGGATIDHYEPGPDSKPQPGVPKGKTFDFKFESSQCYPGTRRDISVYVPAQYRPEKPACVYIGFDGLGFEAATVFDNLIAKGEIPVLIGIGVQPGTTPSAGNGDDPRFNRSVEFDGMDDTLPRFVVEEILPEVMKHKTPDGQPILLSADPNDRCTGGASTGGIAAFTCAWQRPDQFRRVFSAIGTFVDMRGGDRYPILIRQTDPKPIRVFQQDGSNDEWGGGPEVGDWWIGNQYVDRSLEFAGYEHTHVWGDGVHSGKHGEAVFPDAMRYLWKDWPKPVASHPDKSGNLMARWTLDPGSSWEAVAGAADVEGGVVAGPGGEVFWRDGKRIVQKLSVDGSISAVDPFEVERRFAFAPSGRPVGADGLISLTATSAGLIYGTDSSGRLVLIRPDRPRQVLDTVPVGVGVAVSPDGKWLAVMQGFSHFGFSYRIGADGTVDAKTRFYQLHVPDDADEAGALATCFDRDGRLYVATRMGVQVLDRNGRSRLILPLPGQRSVTGVCFGGAKLDTLFATDGEKLYRRHMIAVGWAPFDPPIKLPPWGAG